MHILPLRKLNQQGFHIHLILPVLTILAVAAIGTYLLGVDHAATPTFSGPCTGTTYSTTTVNTGSKAVSCITQAQDLLDGIQHASKGAYLTAAAPSVPYTFAYGSQNYLTMNGTFGTVMATAVQRMDGTTQLTAGTASGDSWEYLCQSAARYGIDENSGAGANVLQFSTIRGQYTGSAMYQIFAATCGSPVGGATGGTGVSANSTECWGTVVTSDDACYYWVGAYQNNNNNFTATGVSSNFTQEEPSDQATANGDNHSLIETFVSSSDGEESLEIGWFVATSTGKAPVLMVTHWVNGSFIGYTSPTAPYGFVQVSSTVKPLSTALRPGAVGNFKIQFANNQWQFWYNNAEVGYFPESLWTSKGITFNKIQWVSDYGEVATHVGVLSKVEMGNGVLGSSSGSAAVSGYKLYGSSTPADFNSFYQPQGSLANYYDIGATSSTGFRLGGPGV